MNNNTIYKYLAILMLSILVIMYVVVTWSFCLSSAWNWFLVPLFHYPPITILQAWAVIMVLNFARPQIDAYKKEPDIPVLIGCLISPWISLLILYILKHIIL